MNNITMKDIKKIEKLIYIVIVLLIVNIFATIIKNEESVSEGIQFDVSMFTNIELSELEEHVKADEYKLLVIGKNNCEYTVQMLPILKKANQIYDYETLYLDQRNITDNNKELLLKYDDNEKFIEKYIDSTPFIIVFKNNQMVDTWVGYQDYNTFEEFLNDLGIEKKEN